MREKGRGSSAIAKKIKEKLGMTLVGYADQKGISYQMLCHLTAGTGGLVYGPAGIGVYGKIANQLKEDGVWVEPVRGGKS